jgi:two-component system sensor histidine kinase AlgZ
MKAPEPGTGRKQLYLPDFCAANAVLAIVLIVELTAIVVTLARESTGIDFWTDLARTSFFLLWIGLAGAGLLCWSKRSLGRYTVAQGSALVLGLIALLVAVVSEGAWRIGQSALAGDSDLFPRERWTFLARNVGIALVVTALALRYFYVTHEWRRNVEMQARARVHALQARIRPHFLFNSMNTIASLTRSDPARAESAVLDLADLFRASLSEQRTQIPLREELEITRTYQRIEELRLGRRLDVRWKVEGLPEKALVPSLVIQPLLENAIYHGIEPRPEGGTVTITGEIANGLITIVVRNPVPLAGAPGNEREGNRLALANIRERLALMYGERSTVKAGRFDDEYIVTLRFPHRDTPAQLGTAA